MIAGPPAQMLKTRQQQSIYELDCDTGQVDLYLFDFDNTLYGYDFRQRLPTLARLTGASQYHLAKTWWVGGYESHADHGGYRTVSDYLNAWQEVTGVELTLAQWREARAAAMTPSPGSAEVLREAASAGTMSLLSNNNYLFKSSLPVLASDLARVVGGNDLMSSDLGVTKPHPEIYLAALAKFGSAPENTFFADDSKRNVAAAASLGINAFLVPQLETRMPDTPALLAAVRAFRDR
jgi:HAD superfamily hydrolase (TIGR01509 family)